MIKQHILIFLRVFNYFQKLNDIQVVFQSFDAFVQIQVPFMSAIVDFLQTFLASAIIATEVIANGVAQIVLKFSSVQNHFVNVVKLLTLWFLTNWFVLRLVHLTFYS